MGAFDSMSGVLMLFGGVHTSGTTQALLGNAIIPITSQLSLIPADLTLAIAALCVAVALSVIFMKKSFTSLQYAGSAIILGGKHSLIAISFPDHSIVHPCSV